jgi:hypothetical protein
MRLKIEEVRGRFFWPKHPTRALQRTAEATPLSGTPWELTGGVWEIACCSGEPGWALAVGRGGGWYGRPALFFGGGEGR